MSQAQSGLTYLIKLDVPGLQMQLQQAESIIGQHVARCNALRISIPATIDMTSFNAAASQIDAKIASWQQGVNIGFNAGLPAFGNVSNNLTNNNLVDNSQQITNYFNQVSNVINNIGQAAQRAAGAAGHGGHGMAGLSRHLGAFAMLRTAEQFIRNEAAYQSDIDKATAPEGMIKADLANRDRYRSVFFGLGNYGVALRNEVGELTGGASAESVERTLREGEQGGSRADEAARELAEQRDLVSKMLVAQSPEGYQRQRKSRELATAEKLRKIDELDEKEKKEKAQEDADRIRIAKEQEDYEQYRSAQTIHDPDNPIEKAYAAQQAAVNERQAAREASHHARVQRESGYVRDTNAADQAEQERKADEQRDSADIRAARDASIQMGANRQQADIAARRAQDALKAKQYDLTMRPDEAASMKMADKQATDLAEKEGQLRETESMGQLILRATAARSELAGNTRQSKLDELSGRHRLAEQAEMDPKKRKALEDANRAEEALAQDKADKDEQKREADSQDKITEIRAKGHQAQLQEAGETQKAELDAFDHAQQARISALDNAIAHEQDADEKRRLIAQREEERAAQAAERSEFLAEQARKLAAQEEASANRIAASRARAGGYNLQAQGKSWQAGEASFKESWDAKIRDAEAAVNAEPDVHKKADRQAELDALRRERASAEGAHAEQGREDIRSAKTSADQASLRGRGMDRTATIVGIKSQYEEEMRKAQGNPELQRQIALKYQGEVNEQERDLHRHGVGQAGYARNDDLTNRYGDKTDSAKDVKNAIESGNNLLTDIKRILENPPPPRAQ